MAKESRIYTRTRNGTTRYYGDFRDYSEVGGGQEALIPDGESYATTDRDVANALVTKRLKKLEAKRVTPRERELLGIKRRAILGDFADRHLKKKSKSGVTTQHLENMQMHLERACEFFGAGLEVRLIGVRDVERWMHALGERPNGRGGTLSPKTVREHLNSLSNLFKRAQSEEVVRPGFNPVAGLMDKPSAARQREARWLEVHDAALLLEAARTYKPPKDKHGMTFMYPMLATFLLTGGRKSEVFGLLVDDVSFDRKTIAFRPHEHRRLKSRTSHRVVPMWPQLEPILREHVFGGDGPRSGLLFPSVRTGRMITDTRRALDAIGERAGFEEGEIRLHRLRHTYCAARLQTLDNGAPVSEYTVMRELGHSSPALVRRVYGHLGEIRHRSEVVEFRVEQHEEKLTKPLRALRKGAKLDTSN